MKEPFLYEASEPFDRSLRQIVELVQLVNDIGCLKEFLSESDRSDNLIVKVPPDTINFVKTFLFRGRYPKEAEPPIATPPAMAGPAVIGSAVAGIDLNAAALHQAISDAPPPSSATAQSLRIECAMSLQALRAGLDRHGFALSERN